MIVKVKLETVYRTTQVVKKGTPDEKEIDKVAIKITESVMIDGVSVPTDKWISTFKTKGTESLEGGQEVKIDITQNGDFFNFSVPDMSGERLTELEKRVGILEGCKAKDVTSVQNAPTGTTNPDDLPF